MSNTHKPICTSIVEGNTGEVVTTCRPQEPMTERDRLIDMLRRNIKTGLHEGNLRRILEYLERGESQLP